MQTKCWIVLLVDRTELHRPQGCLSRTGRRTRQLRRAMLFGSRQRAQNWIDRGGPTKAWRKAHQLQSLRYPPAPWGGRWLAVPTEVRIETGESPMALLELHEELR